MLHQDERDGSPKRMRVPRNDLQTIDAQNKTTAESNKGMGDA